MSDDDMKPINTVVSIYAILHIDSVRKAKAFLAKKCNSNYNILTPHLTYALMPISETNFEEAKSIIIEEIAKIPKFSISLGQLEIENDFVFVEVLGDELVQIHKLFLELLSKFRTSEIREEDLKRLKEGKLTLRDQEYLRKYGFYRILDQFKSHITIGNIVDSKITQSQVLEKIGQMLEDKQERTITIKNIQLALHTDAENQKDMKILFHKSIQLQ